MIEVRDLVKQYKAVRALDGLSFKVGRGQIFGLLGPNGAGKTTTLKILCGMIPASSGEAFVGGHSIKDEPIQVKRIIGLVPETAAVYEELTGSEYMELIGNLRMIDSTVVTERVHHFTKFLDLDEQDLGRQIGSYSRGMWQKLLIITALLHNPEVVFMDEALSGLDANVALKIKELLRMLKQQGKTFVFSSHVLDQIERICDRIAILFKGRLLACGTVEEIMRETEQPTLELAFHSLTSTEDLSKTTSDFLKELEGQKL